MDWASGQIVVAPTKHVRVHWQGSGVWKHRASIDIITDSYVGEFAAIRSRETDVLPGKMTTSRMNIESCWASESLDVLVFERAPRGTTGLPLILGEILLKEREKKAKQPKLGASQPDEPKVTTASETR